MPKRLVRFDLDINPKPKGYMFDIKQGDSALIEISLYDDKTPFNIKGVGTLYVAIGNDIYDQTDVRVERDRIVIDMDRGLTSSVGKACAEIEVVDDEGICTTATFLFEVYPRLNEKDCNPPQEPIEGIYKRLSDLIKEHKEMIDEFEMDSSNLIDIANKTIGDTNLAIEKANETIADTVKAKEDMVEKVDKTLEDINLDILENYQKKVDDGLSTTDKTIVGAINEIDNGKVNKIDGKGLSTNDFTNKEKLKLEILENYTHPNTHEATMITQDDAHRFVTDEEKSNWNNKSDSDHVHNQYLTEIPSEYITDIELDSKGYLTEHQDISGKVDKIEGKELSSNDFTDEEKSKLSILENYTHPNDSSTRHVTDDEKQAWNNKSDLDHTHSQYLTEIPNEYITETELDNKEYLAKHQDVEELTTDDKSIVGAINEINTRATTSDIDKIFNEL